MRKSLLFLWPLLCVACQTKPINQDNGYHRGPLPSFTYLDSILPYKKINCGSGEPIDCLACTLQGEAANQNSQGVYAVGVTIMTRANGDPDKICKVTSSKRQFEGNQKRGHRKISKKIWEVSRYVLARKEVGWTHFWAPKEQAKLRRSKPRWAYRYEARQCQQKKIDDHIFYNKNKCVFKKGRGTASTK